ncbi:molybdate ABC transporter substrate-binding protein [Enterobacteriaceae bacterium LUAb1]
MLVKWIHGIIGVVLSISAAGQAIAADKITVFAAASLTNALDDIAAQYQRDKNVEIVAAYAASSTLARQIEQGAPADIFISADQQWMEYAIAKQAIDDTSCYTLLGNTLVLVAPLAAKSAQVTINQQTDWLSLLKGERLAVGDPDHVPAGIYAKQALQHLGAWKTLSPVLARASNVRAALALVERQEAPYGIVYGSDAVASKKVVIAGIFPPDSHLPVEYPMAMVRQHNNAVVTAFYRWLQGPEAAAVFKQYGFTPRR